MRWMSPLSRLSLLVLAVSLAACEGKQPPNPEAAGSAVGGSGGRHGWQRGQGGSGVASGGSGGQRVPAVDRTGGFDGHGRRRDRWRDRRGLAVARRPMALPRDVGRCRARPRTPPPGR